MWGGVCVCVVCGECVCVGSVCVCVGVIIQPSPEIRVPILRGRLT